MSFTFDVNNEEIWSPANKVARLYLDTVDAASRYVDRPTGLTDVSGDWYTIEPDAFRDFVGAMLHAYVERGRGDVRALLRGPLAVSLDLLRRADIALDGRTENEVAALTELRSELPF
ncbi:DUF6086 family protein [Dactylosporangium darangshiense]|uniref:Uncharacterized protein n=1 Tax=Dactylosporangium darangshiense TaxID=579108 RepID=A0ABP8D6S8_9ACTN